MQNPDNINPAERVDEIMAFSNKYGRTAVISYLLNELAYASEHKRFDDQCYWMDVKAEFDSRLIYDN